MFRPKSKSIDVDLFKISSDSIIMNRIEKMNSWNENPMHRGLYDTDKNEIKKKVSKFNFKKIFFDLMTSDFDKKLENNLEIMRNSSIKLLSFLNDSEKEKVIKYTENVVLNLIVLILSDINNISTKRIVKYNIHFYLKLAEKASNNGDHQTAIIILIALNNYNIKRLNLKYSKSQDKIIKKLEGKYGYFNNCYKNHIREIIKQNNIFQFIDNNYIPSAYILYIMDIVVIKETKITED